MARNVHSGRDMTHRTTTRPATPAAKRHARDAGRYSLVAADDRDRPTIPPAPAEVAAVREFERAIAAHGEPQARTINLMQAVKGRA